MPPCIYSAHSQIVPYRSRSIPHKTVLFVYDSRNEQKNVGQRVRALREESNLTQEQLKRTLMPVGGYTKEEIREMAAKNEPARGA